MKLFFLFPWQCVSWRKWLFMKWWSWHNDKAFFGRKIYLKKPVHMLTDDAFNTMKRMGGLELCWRFCGITWDRTTWKEKLKTERGVK